MKKSVFLIAVLALWGCTGDLIETIDSPDSSGDESGQTVTTLTDPNLSWSESSCAAVLGSENTFPTLTNQYGVSVTYSSSATSVATVSSDGTVTLVAAGSSIITASSAETDIYEAGSVSYTLTVSKNTDGISWSTNNCTVTIGSAENTFPTLNNPGGQTIAYSSSNPAVATIASDGTVTLVSAGATTITATSQESSNYISASVSYSLTVQEKGSNLKSADLSWPSTEYDAILGTSFTSPVLTNPHGLAVSYDSSSPSVATISSEGTITLSGAGTTTITASSEATDTYTAGSAFYTLTVNKASASLSWSESSYTATLASTDNSYPTLSNPNGLSIKYSSSNTEVATIDGSGQITLISAGTVSIVASSEATDIFASATATYTLKVVKQTISLTWSASSYTASLEGGNTFPTLTVSPEEAITPTYSSSDPSVATIASDGTVTLVAVGTTVISATFEGNETYKASSASYKLTVASAADDGAGSYTFTSSGDSSSDDDISNTTFTRMVTVTYSSSGAAVKGYSASSDLSVSVNGAHVTVINSGSESIVYKLTGTTSNGSFTLYSSKKQAIWLSDVSITSTIGAAINNQSGKRTFVYVEGSNTLSDSSSASYSTSGDEDMKGVVFSEGQLVFSGSGTLTVNANNAQSKSGIVSDDYVRFMASPTVKVVAGSSAGHGIRGKEFVQVSDGTLGVTTKAAMKKGIGSDDYVLVEGGATTITVGGGVAYDSDDAEYKGSAGIKADNYFAMTGGYVTITNSGAGGKGISAGSYDYDSTTHAVADSYISGGTLKITTTGSESNDVSSKGIKIGWVTKSGSGDRATVTGYAGNLKISGGSVVVSSSKSEGVEAKGNLTISGGEVYVTSAGDDAINCQAEMNITGGYVYAYSSANDAMDANHDLKISGGYVFAVTTKGSPEVAIDANTESGYKLYINSGATVVAYGGLESGYSASQSVYSMSCTAGSWNALYAGSSYLAAFKAPSGVSSVAVSAPSLSKGYKGVSVGSTTYANGIWATSGITGGSAVSLSSYSGGGGSGGGNGGGPGGRH